MKLYVLNEKHEPVVCEDQAAWAKWKSKYHMVASSQLNTFRVSTIFLGLDHGDVEGDPLLWETMIFNDRNPTHPLHQWQERHSSYAKALECHLHAQSLVSDALHGRC